jgi:hypothetical protein
MSMPAPFVDFVSALSAEQSCGACAEPYATVDQQLCSDCGAVLCPDCARLTPKAQWTCGKCEKGSARIFAAVSRAPVVAVRSYAASLREPSQERVLALAEPTLAPSHSAVQRAFVLLFGALLTLSHRAWEASRAATLRKLADVESSLAEHLQRVQLSWQQDSRAIGRGLAEMGGAGLSRFRVALSEFVLSIRNAPLREHVAGLLLGTAILIAVARSSHRSPR